ncbi:hypothetical protein P5F04_08255 [Clostridium perfringens]|uniref:hypothetical protein n=1 Tax=Clostridium perfringens TaxID=1502 RepID=UPI001F59FF3A|nr:hypothetical protein [Clostridium perfringens]MCI2779140.1 hypothetical protein [Clostridium perfringens]MDK0626909.1 hypothetical protein [Clostridium perfringens]MDK0664760.1 hypothetical protein [Clostridium perfringens]
MITKVKTTKIINISSLVLTFLMIFTFISPNITAYASTKNDDQSLETISNELEFYFSKVGHLDENNNYVITNPELLKERANSGDKGAKKLYTAYIQKQYNYTGIRPRSYFEFGKCILYSYLGPIYELMDGKFAQALGAQVASDSWRAAGTILKMALSEASKIAGKTVGGAFAVAELAYYAYTCRGKL